MEINNDNIYYVYLHICETTKKTIYIGKGKNDRAYQTKGRSKKWNKYMKDNKFSVEMYKENLSELDALTIEHELIKSHNDKEYLLNVTGIDTPQIRIITAKDKKYRDKKAIIAERQEKRDIELEKRKKVLEEQKKNATLNNTKPITVGQSKNYSSNSGNQNNHTVSESEKRQLNYLYGTGRLNEYHYYNKRSKW